MDFIATLIQKYSQLIDTQQKASDKVIKCHYAECDIFYCYSDWLSVAFFIYTLSVLMLNGIILIVIMLKAIMQMLVSI